MTTTTPKPETADAEIPQTKPIEVPITEPKSTPESPVHNDDIDNNIISTYNKPEPAFPPNTIPDYLRPQSPVQVIPYEPETTYSPITEATSPKLVFMNVGKETAIVKGEKTEDGSVFVDIQNVPKNKWTKIDEKPNCERGFEPGFFGECNGM